jgi:hypothetical protein
MKKLILSAIALTIAVGVSAQGQRPQQQPDPNRMRPGMTEFYTPVPKVVTPGDITTNSAPSDAVVLFDGKDLSAWSGRGGGPAEWDVHDGVFTVNKKKGDIQTRQHFNSFQLHIEWCVPENITGESQARGNSGVFLQGMYEIQILDCYNNKTYTNGQTGSVYKQSTPLANAMRKPGEWNVYDIIYNAPVFNADGSYRVPPTVTVIHNGVLLQNNVVIRGTTEYIGHPQVKKHGPGPIILQSHGDPSEPISFRNIWIREL